MRKLIVTALAALGVLAGSLVSAAPASAAPAGWTSWLMPTGTVCVQTGGSTYWPIARAVSVINATDASMVARSSCSGYKRSMTVKLVAYYNSSDSTCASTGSYGWTWQKVRGAWVWTPNAPYIKVNMARWAKSWCQGTYAKRLYLMSHELLHVLGLDHRYGTTVMVPRVSQMRYSLPTSYDKALVNRRY